MDSLQKKMQNSIRTHAFRLKPNEDLYDSILSFAKNNKIKAGSIQTCVGSLKVVNIRLANASKSKHLTECFEICSLVGTLCESGLHLHISLSDSNGNMLGGHVLPGCKIYTTAEIVILELCDLLFTREMDAETGFKELIVTNKEKQ